MCRWVSLAIVGLMGAALPVQAEGITGRYVEARTCDVWTGPCFANAEMNLGGKNAVMAWKIERGTLNNVRLDGLAVVAVVVSSDTLGLVQTGPARALLIVDSKANAAQRKALVQLARHEAGDLAKKVIRVETAPVSLDLPECKDGGCAILEAGKARIETRCLSAHHDKVCGNESAFYPPLGKHVKAQPALAVEESYSGTGFNETWKEMERRGAYVGTFAMN